MKKKFVNMGGSLLVLCTLVTIFISCKKTNYGLTGTYAGTTYTGGGVPNDTVTITAGKSLTSFIITDPYSGTVLNASAISDSLTIPMQQFTVKNITYTWYGTGDASQGALSLTLYYINASNDTIEYDFSGVRE